MKKKVKTLLEGDNLVKALTALSQDEEAPNTALVSLKSYENPSEYEVKITCQLSEKSYNKIRKLIKKQRKEYTKAFSPIIVACATGDVEE